ncbi:MAG TPA: GWxTD domain-containing protein [Gemmatimonadaceae bacterium]|nr:GWxTD domain-containing protein [Gemmatimonadaceae bacterium]
MAPRHHPSVAAAHLVFIGALLGACVGAPPGSPSSPPPGEAAPAPAPAAAPAAPPASANAPGTPATPGSEGFALYRQEGLLAQPGSIPFVGSVRYFAGPSPDTTLVLVALSLANRSFMFSQENGANVAHYAVGLSARDSAATVAQTLDEQQVRVATYKETTRTDQSIVFQRYLVLRPGRYTLVVAVSDRGSSTANSGQLTITVPRLGAGHLSSPVNVNRATPRDRLDTLPDLIANPRATLIFGRDSIAPVYLEAYALPAGSRIAISIANQDGVPLIRDTVTLTRAQAVAGAVFDMPMSRVGLGRRIVQASVVGAPDSVSTPLWVTVGEGFGIVNFEELLSYLRYFATPERLQQLRDLPPNQRAAGWAQFWKETDPNPSTVENEALVDYFERIRIANEKFKEQGTPGWLTDRGKVYITLGEPDQIMGSNPNPSSQSGTSQYWSYVRFSLRLQFVDQNGYGRWRLTPQSESAFDQVANRERVH